MIFWFYKLFIQVIALKIDYINHNELVSCKTNGFSSFIVSLPNIHFCIINQIFIIWNWLHFFENLFIFNSFSVIFYKILIFRVDSWSHIDFFDFWSVALILYIIFKWIYFRFPYDIFIIEIFIERNLLKFVHFYCKNFHFFIKT
jgi:hypothetical protein